MYKEKLQKSKMIFVAIALFLTLLSFATACAQVEGMDSQLSAAAEDVASETHSDEIPSEGDELPHAESRSATISFNHTGNLETPAVEKTTTGIDTNTEFPQTALESGP